MASSEKPSKARLLVMATQPQECVALHQRLVEEVKEARIQGEPETMIRRDIPGEEKRQTGDIKQ